MAHSTGYGSRFHVSVDPPLHQIPKDLQGMEVPVPLSPQWLLPKAGDQKLGAPGEGHPAPYSVPGNFSESKSSGNSEAQKKKDVFRPSFFDMESGRRDQWRDEERDANASMRRDRWRDGDRELDGTRRVGVEQWGSSSTRQFGEARRVPSERRTDYGNRESSNNLERESKWNARWGPGNKETEAAHEKYMSSGKSSETMTDQVVLHLSNHMKDEKDTDRYRPWRGASMQARGKGEPPQNQSLASNKHVNPTYSSGRVLGENTPPTSLGRGRSGSIGNSIDAIQPFGTKFDKGYIGHGEEYNYNRMKLLDVYRTVDMKSYLTLRNELIQLTFLTKEEPLEPLALCAPSVEETDIMKGIDVGDIVSSGAPQVTKDGSFGRSSMDFSESKRANHGSRDDLPPVDESRDDKGLYADSLGGFPHDQLKQYYKSTKQMLHDGLAERNINLKDAGDESYRKDDRGFISEELVMQGDNSTNAGNTWHGGSLDDHLHRSSKIPSDVKFETLETRCTQPQKGPNDSWLSRVANPPLLKDENWLVNEGAGMARQAPAYLNSEQEARMHLRTPPENLILYYKDPQGLIQGPFSGSDIIGWFEAGYFGIDLHVRLAGAPSDSAFSLLGDVMPHLRSKARPPPGFKPGESEIVEPMDLSGGGSLRAPLSGTDSSERRPASAKEAENRFLESLMSNKTSSTHVENRPFAEGLQGYMEKHHPTAGPSLGVDGGEPYLLAKRIALERQRSMHNTTYSHIGRDSVLPLSEIAPNSIRHPATGNSRLPQSQNVDLMSILQGGLPERPSPNVGNASVNWSSFPAQGGGFNPVQDQIGLLNPQSFSSQALFGQQQQMLQHPTLLPQSMDNSSANATMDSLILSGSLNDHQLQSLLQQQHLLRFQPQAPVPAQQLSVLDKFFLLKQQEEQQQQQLLQQRLLQQQQLLSRILLNNQSNQHVVDPSFPHLQMGNSMNILQTQPQDLLRAHEVGNVYHSTVPESLPFHLPQQIPGDGNQHRDSLAPILNIHEKEPWPSSTIAEISPSLEVSGGSLVEGPHVDQTMLRREFEAPFSESTVTAQSVVTATRADSIPLECPGLTDAVPLPGTCENDKIHKEGTIDTQVVEEEGSSEKPAMLIEVKDFERSEVKKVSDKKLRKQKTSKSSSVTDQKKVSKPPLQQPLPSEADSDAQTREGQEPGKSMPQRKSTDSLKFVDSQHFPEASADTSGQVDVKVTPQPDEQLLQPGQRAWKAPSGFKVKSLLEIQQEEEKRAQVEVAVSGISSSLSSVSVPTPWAGANPESKISGDTNADACGSGNGLPISSKISGSQLLSTVAEEEFSKFCLLQSEVPAPAAVEEDDNFIEAKESKRSRKRSAAKAKNAGAKALVSVASDLPAASVEKSKSSCATQQDKEVLPAIPLGPSLGDFVPWKAAESAANSSPTPAWSIDSGKVAKPTASLRDILKEQENKVSSVKNHQMRTAQKSQLIQAARGASSGSSAAKAASANQVNSITSSQDVLFWGSSDQSRETDKKLEFRQLANHGSKATKSTPVKGTPPRGSLSREKSTGVARQLESSLSSSPASAQSSLKGKKETMSKHSEAMDFRDWCQNECARLLGSTDTSFLEFCLKQSRSEAEMLLIANLGSLDPDHEFIDKFLNYMELLPAEVLGIAFEIPSSTQKAPTFNRKPDNRIIEDDSFLSVGVEGSSKGSKKKGKKGKKVSASVLGFNVVSNRIMMGEIQTLED